MNELFRQNYHPILHGLIVYCDLSPLPRYQKPIETIDDLRVARMGEIAGPIPQLKGPHSVGTTLETLLGTI